MKLFGFKIVRIGFINALSERNAMLFLVNRGFAEEIEKLEKELKKYKRPRNKKGQFMSESAANFKRVHDALRAKYGKEMLDDVIPNYNDIKEASKMEGFGR